MKKYISIILITLAVAWGGCKKTYLSELAINPNSPAQTTPALGLTGALKTTAGIANSTMYNNYLCWMGYMSWSTSFQPNLPLEAFNITTSSYDDFTSLYLNISNYTAVLNSTPEPYFQAMAKIMIAYDYENLVDNYNNVPYSQAMKGASNLTPAYDNASAIYDDLLVQLDAAIKLIQGASSTAALPGSADIMFGANSAAKMNNWILFANTLKLRIAVRQSTNPALASKKGALTTSIQATAALGYISTTAEGNINPGYVNIDANGGQQAPLALNLGLKQAGTKQTNTGQYQANSYAINFFTSNNDPRLTQIYAPSASAAAAGAVIGTAFGVTTPPTVIVAGKSTTVAPSTLSTFMQNPTKSAVVLSAAESLFLQAEAVNVGYLTGDANALYNAGVTASFTEDGLTVAAANTYLSQAAVQYPAAGTAAQKEQAIITQKWAALDPYNPFEAYNEFRRTGYPAVPVSIYTGNTSPKTPTRIPYPKSEYDYNANNVPAAIDIFNSKIFWQQ